MLIDVPVSEQIQRPVDIPPHGLRIPRREEALPHRLRDRLHDRLGAHLADRLHLVGLRRDPSGREGVVGKNRGADGLQQGREVGWPEELAMNLRREESAGQIMTEWVSRWLSRALGESRQ